MTQETRVQLEMLSRYLKEEPGADLLERAKSFRFTQQSRGAVACVMDDVVQVEGLSGSRYGEILAFEGGGASGEVHYGLALDLRENGVGAVMLSGAGELRTGAWVRGTGRVADVCAGPELLGRIIDPIGRPLDGKPLKTGNLKFRPVENPAP
ncbi:MAG: hypothetical protein FWC27_00425, partial [Firmicutes bacterium]|nr:hypothetical protein [Bacillota bacterium]